MPTTRIAVPAIGNTLYRPNRVIARPDRIAAARSPAISGIIRRPEPVGLAS